MDKRLSHTGRVFLILCICTFLCAGCVEPPSPDSTPQPSPPDSSPQQPAPDIDTAPPTIEVIQADAPQPGADTLHFEWSGSDDTSASSDLVYSCFLEGYDSDWSPFTQATSADYSGVEVGTYIFYVKCRDEAGNTSPVPPEVQIVLLPADEGDILPAGFDLYPGSDVSALAIGSYGNVIYALDANGPALYRSESGPLGWNDLSSRLNAPPSWDDLCSAPDDNDFLAVVTSSRREVSLTNDGGTTFFSTGLAGGLNAGEYIQCIAVSPHYNNTHEIAVGTATGSGSGRVLMLKAGTFSGSWQDISTGITGWQSPTGTGIDVFALEYSPSYTSDSTLLALGASGPSSAMGNTYLYMGIRDLAGTTITWNSTPSFPVEVSQTGQDTPGTPLVCADLALPVDFSGASASGRHIYASWSDNPPGTSTVGSNHDDVYRIDGTTCIHLNVPHDAINSLAYYGRTSSGILLAGALWSSSQTDYPGVQVYCTFDPASASPSWQISSKPPTGQYHALVAWSPDGQTAYCGTIGQESALSFSRNDGLTWNQ